MFYKDDASEAVVALSKKLVAGFDQTCVINLSNFSSSGSPFVLWNVVNNACVQAMSDALVQGLHSFAKPNQPIPKWVQSLPPKERAEKIAMIQKYGSPNVFSQFQPHVTVAYDTEDNVTQIYGKLGNQKVAYKTTEVQISKVGPFGTVVKGGSVANISMSAYVKMRKHHVSHKHSNDDNSFDYFLFVREWPGSMTPNPVPSYVDTFLLHGLWPNRYDGSYPSFCNDSYPFRYSEISDIITQLDDAWYDALHDQANASSFWGHEWDKHGTCAMSDDCCGSEKKYFETAIKLHNSNTIVQWLQNAGIVPSDSKQYSKDDFVSAIATGMGNDPLIRCDSHNGKNVILDIGACFDKDINPIKCPSSLIEQWQNEERCDDYIWFPTIPH